MDGLMIGKVTANYDKDHPGMLKVCFPALDAEGGETFWLPVATPYAGKNYGMYNLAEVGDSVVVGFAGSDPHSGIVLGSLWNSVNTIPADTAAEENNVKSFVTKGGSSVVITDGEEGGITVKTSGGFSITLSDKDKKTSIVTGDAKNSITLDEQGATVSIVSDDKLTIKGKEILLEGKLTLKGSEIALQSEGNLSLKGKALKVEGTTIALSGQSSFEASGASVKVESNGILTLKGSLTKIN